MIPTDSFGNSFIFVCILIIQNNEDKIKTGKKGICHADIFRWWLVFVVFTVYGICCCNDGASCVERAMNTSFCNCDCLLFHNFMDCYSISIVHLIKLINTNNTSICQHHCTCFKSFFTSLSLRNNCCCQTNATCSTTRCTNTKVYST